MSAHEAPETKAFRELESLVRNLGEELAVFRRRAIAAEAQLKDGGGSSDRGKGKGATLGAEFAELESENRALKLRVERAEERVRQLMDRVRFLRQQVQLQAPTATASRS